MLLKNIPCFFSSPVLALDGLKLHDDSEDSADEEWGQSATRNCQRQRTVVRSDSRDHFSSALKRQPSEADDLVGPVPSTASLHRPPSYNQMKSAQAEKIRRAGASGLVQKKG